jgi:N-methylhydantoinase B/oxoprolinase/acetone carboxylase alpha subunit
MEITNREGTPFGIFATFERTKFAARGREGAEPGALGRLTLKSGSTLRNKGFQVIPEHDRLIVEMPGGGGYGDPLARDVKAVRGDVHKGLVSRRAAERDYGVSFHDDLTLNPEATAKLRTAAR